MKNICKKLMDRKSRHRYCKSKHWKQHEQHEFKSTENYKLNNKSIITFVLDESGSMDRFKDATINGFNEYLETLKNENVECKFQLILFNSSKNERRYNFEDIKNIAKIEEGDYIPENLTPLYDSIGRGINETDIYIKKNRLVGNVIFTIMTDGLENASSQYTRSDIFRKISSRTKRDWNFVFLGSNQDTWIEGQKMGIRRGFTADYGWGREQYAMRYLGRRTSEFDRELTRGIRKERFFREEDRGGLKGY